MKKTFLFIALACGFVAASAENVLKVADVDIPQGQEGFVYLELKNEVTFTGFQFNLNLPEGITLISQEKNSSRFADDHSVGFTTHDLTSVFTAFSSTNNPISDSEGLLLTLCIKADASIGVGTVLSGSIDEIYFGTEEEEEYVLDPVTFNITIVDGTGIESLTQEKDDKPTYNLLGQRIQSSKARRGVYVREGRKFAIQ